MVISRIGAKRSKKEKATASEPPALNPAASLVSDKPASLYEFLRNSGYLIDRTSAGLMQVALELPGMKALLLEGPPGVGKTALTEKIAQWLGADYIYVLATPNTDEDALLYKFVPDENNKSGIRVAEGPLTQAVKKAAAGKKVVLVIDEFDKTRPSTDALLLDLLQNGRVTLYLGGREDVLVANPNNLYVFLTSNAMREFSEPLMRRLVRVDFKLLDPSDVAELLRKRFDGQTANLLAEIYQDTVEAGLRKPATIQELLQLGYALKKMPNAPLDRLLRMYVIKYDDDWEKFMEYLKGKLQQSSVSRLPPSQPTTQQTQQQASAQQSAAASPPQVDYRTQMLGASGDVYMFKAPFSEDVYTAIARMAVPGRSPDELGKFKAVQIDGERVIVSKEPLTVEEYQHLYDNTKSDFEAYIEDRVPMVIPDDVEELIRAASTVKAYSERYVAVASKNGDVEEEIHIELPEPLTSHPKLVEAAVKAYAKAEKVEGETPRVFSTLLSRIHDMQKKMCSKRLKLSAGVADVVADVVSACMSSGVAPDIRVEGTPTGRDVEEVEKALATRGFKVERGNCGGKHSEIIVEKGYGDEIAIRCW
jgi:MoxR-like ATPase